MIYRRAGLQDINDTWKLHQELLEHESVFCPAMDLDQRQRALLLAQTIERIDSPSHPVFLAMDGENYAGILLVNWEDKTGWRQDVAEVGAHLREPWRHNSYFYGLFRAALRWARNHGINVVQFQVLAGNTLMEEMAARHALPVKTLYEMNLPPEPEEEHERRKRPSRKSSGEVRRVHATRG